MNLFYNLPEEIERYIYEFDSTYSEKFDLVLEEFKEKIDLTSSCGYEFKKGTTDAYLQNKLKPKQCDCYFCIEL